MRKKLFKLFLYTTLLVFVLINTVAFFHAYKFTHFCKEKNEGKDNDDKPAHEYISLNRGDLDGMKFIVETTDGKPVETK